MNIALNALCISNQSGTGRYAYGLIDGIAKSGVDDIYLMVFLPSGFNLPLHWQKCPSIRFYSIPSATAWQRIYWEQSVLPLLLRTLGITALLSPAFISPCLFPNKIRHIITIHDAAYLTLPQTIPYLRRLYLRTMIKRSVQRADCILTDSQAVAEELRGACQINKPIHPVHLGVDTLKFTPHKSEHDVHILNQHQLTQSYYLFVGTIEPRKNIETVLKAYQHARKKRLITDFVIAGRYGWMVDQTVLQTEGIRWLGHVDDDDLPALYRHADALIAPSLYEGFDLPAVEALACGTPVLASDIAVHREVLGGQCQYFPALDADAWTNAFLHSKTMKQDVSYNRNWVEVATDTLRCITR